MDQRTIKRHLDVLAAKDPDLRRGLAQAGYPAPRIREPGFGTLVATIVSQQISTAAAAAIMQRLHALAPVFDAPALLDAGAEALRAAGLSQRKVEYVTGLARAVVDDEFDPSSLGALDDADAMRAITSLRGFGRWSAEVYLMFSLRRPDVFPAGDLALRTALQRLKRVDRSLDEPRARELVADWAPFRSAGSLFLWHYYRGAPV